MTMPTNSRADLGAIVFCTLAWSTTWYAITLQLGAVADLKRDRSLEAALHDLYSKGAQ